MTVEHRERGARRERLAAEGRGVVAGRERGRDVGARPARADRHAVAERLGHRDDVGPRRPACSNPNHLPVRPRPVCTSSMISSASRSSHSARTPCEVLGRRGMHAALALHRLRASPRHTRSSIAAASASRSSNATWRKPVGQRLERLLLLRLAGRGERRERAAVERAVRARCTWKRSGPPLRLAVAGGRA